MSATKDLLPQEEQLQQHLKFKCGAKCNSIGLPDNCACVDSKSHVNSKAVKDTNCTCAMPIQDHPQHDHHPPTEVEPVQCTNVATTFVPANNNNDTEAHKLTTTTKTCEQLESVSTSPVFASSFPTSSSSAVAVLCSSSSASVFASSLSSQCSVGGEGGSPPHCSSSQAPLEPSNESPALRDHRDVVESSTDISFPATGTNAVTLTHASSFRFPSLSQSVSPPPQQASSAVSSAVSTHLSPLCPDHCPFHWPTSVIVTSSSSSSSSSQEPKNNLPSNHSSHKHYHNNNSGNKNSNSSCHQSHHLFHHNRSVSNHLPSPSSSSSSTSHTLTSSFSSHPSSSSASASSSSSTSFLSRRPLRSPLRLLVPSASQSFSPSASASGSPMSDRSPSPPSAVASLNATAVLTSTIASAMDGASVAPTTGSSSPNVTGSPLHQLDSRRCSTERNSSIAPSSPSDCSSPAAPRSPPCDRITSAIGAASEHNPHSLLAATTAQLAAGLLDSCILTGGDTSDPQSPAESAQPLPVWPNDREDYELGEVIGKRPL